MIPKFRPEFLPPNKANEDIDLVIAHWANFAPMRSGMYQTVKELIAAENRIEGVMAGLVNPDNSMGGEVDNSSGLGLVSQSHEWAFSDANMHMIHYHGAGISQRLKPRSFMIHGTPEACIFSELSPEEAAGKSMTAALNGLQECDATFVMSKRHEYMWKAFDKEDKLHYVAKGIDLNRYHPDGMRMDLDGEPSILYGEVARRIKDPLLLFYALKELGKTYPDVKFNLWSMTEGHQLWQRIIDDGGFAKYTGKYMLSGVQAFPEHWYRRGDILFSSTIFGEPSRVVMEAMACGCPIVMWDSNHFDGYDILPVKRANSFDTYHLAEVIADLWEEIQKDPEGMRTKVRSQAEQLFNIDTMAEQVVSILRNVR